MILDKRSIVALNVVVCFAIASFIMMFGMQQFGGYDQSALIDCAWRMYNHQKPYTDFPITFPVGFLMGSKTAFSIFGVQWRAFVEFDALFACATFLWASWLFNRILGKPVTSAICSLSLQAATNLVCCFWWYNSMTSILCCITLLSFLVFLKENGWCSLLISTALALLCKPNSVFILVTGAAAVLMLSKNTTWTKKMFLLFIVSASCALACSIIWLYGISVVAMLHSYLGVFNRGISSNLLMIGVGFDARWKCFLVVVLICSSAMFARFKLSARSALCYVAIAAAAMSLYNSGESKIVDASLAWCALIILINRREVILMFCAALILSGCYMGAIRERVKSMGEGFFWESGACNEVHGGFFDSLICGPKFQDALLETDGVMRLITNGPAWFGTRMQWGYANYNIIPPTHQPPYWEPGTAFPVKNETNLFDVFMNSKFKYLITYMGEFGYYSQQERNTISEHYDIRAAMLQGNKQGNVFVLERKDR